MIGVRTAEMAIGWHIQGTRAEADLAVLDTVPMGSRIAVAAACGGRWQMDGFQHLPSMAVVRRDAFVNTNFDINGAQPMDVIYRPGRGYHNFQSVRVSGGAVPCKFPPLQK